MLHQSPSNGLSYSLINLYFTPLLPSILFFLPFLSNIKSHFKILYIYIFIYMMHFQVKE